MKSPGKRIELKQKSGPGLNSWDPFSKGPIEEEKPRKETGRYQPVKQKEKQKYVMLQEQIEGSISISREQSTVSNVAEQLRGR